MKISSNTLITSIILLTLSRPVWAYSELIVLGDSLSDSGNLASLTIDFPWPYYENRVSNGALAVDVLAATSCWITRQPTVLPIPMQAVLIRSGRLRSIPIVT